jgi:hypothetical protein
MKKGQLARLARLPQSAAWDDPLQHLKEALQQQGQAEDFTMVRFATKCSACLQEWLGGLPKSAGGDDPLQQLEGALKKVSLRIRI